MTTSHTDSIIPIRDPDEIRNVQQKFSNNREAWTTWRQPDKARRETLSTSSSRWWNEYGRFYRFRYRLNIYLKNQDERTTQS